MQSLALKEGLHLRHPDIQRLVSEIEIGFHGLGGGSERQTTVSGIFAKQLWIANNLALYFLTVHDKRPKIRTKAQIPVEHQLPPSLMPLFILFRHIITRLEDEESNSIIPLIPSRTFTMKNAICQHFGIDPNVVSLTDIRKLYTSATNIIHAEMVKRDKLRADDRSARQNNHTPAVHQRYYETALLGWQGRWYEGYHCFFGETVHSGDIDFSLVQEPITADQQRSALQCLFGQLARFNSPDQERMAELSCNSHEMHKFFGLPCGHGKTLSLLIPLVVEKMTKRFSGCRVFILPYGFLKDSLFEAFSSKLQMFAGMLDIKCHSAGSITETEMPSELTADNPPDVLILTIDAVANLVQYHPFLLRSWKEASNLRGIFIDEIQTLVSEYSFRPAIQHLRKLAELEVPLTILSGSYPARMIPSMMRYLCGADESDIQSLQSTDLVGTGLQFEVIKSNAAVDDTIKLMNAYHENTGRAVHVLCASKKDCIEFGERCKEDSGVAIVHAGVPKLEQARIAKAWFEGKITKLFTTSLGIVGNENGLMGLVIFVGLLHDISSLLQGCGRLRPKQRGPLARVYHIVSDANLSPNSNLTKEADGRREQLLQVGLIDNESINSYNAIFHIDGYKTFFETDGCYLERLLQLFSGGEGNDKCQRCTWCRLGTRRTNLESILQDQFSAEAPNREAEVDTANDSCVLDSDTANDVSYDEDMVNSEAETNLLSPTPVDRRGNTGGDSTDTQHTVTSTVAVVRRLVRNPYAKKASQSASTQPIQRQTPVQKSGVRVQQACNNQVAIKNIALRKLAWLKEHCPNCKTNRCPGECLRYICFKCGGKGHGSAACTYGARKRKKIDGSYTTIYNNEEGKALDRFIQDRRVCGWCLGKLNREKHGPAPKGTTRDSVCTLQKRLRCAIFMECQKPGNSYGNVVRSVHSSDDAFYSFVAGLNIRC